MAQIKRKKKATKEYVLINGICVIFQRKLLVTQSCEMCGQKKCIPLSERTGKCWIPNGYLGQDIGTTKASFDK